MKILDLRFKQLRAIMSNRLKCVTDRTRFREIKVSILGTIGYLPFEMKNSEDEGRIDLMLWIY